MILRRLFAALLLLAPLAARADGPGIALSDDARLHLFLETELRYDSLAGQGGIGATNGAGTVVQDPADFIWHIRPGATVIESGTQITLTGSANLDYVDYTGWLAPDHSLSYLGAAVAAALTVGKTGPVGFTVDETFSRSDHTTNPALGIGSITDSNDLGARIAFRPGGGAIEGGLAYDFGVQSYELHADGNVGCDPSNTDCNGSQYSNFDSTSHRFALDARWRFFPKTAVVLDSSLVLQEYSDASANIGTTPFLVEGGLAGLITDKIRAVVKGGYLNTFASSGDNFSGAIAQIEVGWNPLETAGATAGVLRTVQPVSGTYLPTAQQPGSADGAAWYEDWRAYLNGKLQLGGRLQLALNANLDIIDFADSNRQDTQAQIEGIVDVELFRMFHAALGSVLTSRDSSLGGVFTYQRAEVYVRLNFTY